jgi:hypothetical protein
MDPRIKKHLYESHTNIVKALRQIKAEKAALLVSGKSEFDLSLLSQYICALEHHKNAADHILGVNLDTLV